MNERQSTDNGSDPAQLERDIDRTRMSLGRTVDELEERLSPGQLLDQALGMVRRHGGEFATNLGRSVENNPVPMLLTGVGLAWMMASSNEPRAASRREQGQTAENAAHRAAEAKQHLRGGLESAKSRAAAVGDSASRARESVGHAISHAGERVRHTGENVRMQGDRVKQGFYNLLEEQPLVVGAIGIALGAALGALLPRTEQEDRLLGDVSDDVVRSVKEKGAEAYEQVRDTAAEAVESRQEKDTPPLEQPAVTAPEPGSLPEPGPH